LRILLDGRPLKTPLKNPFQLPSRKIADVVAAEWDAQQKDVNPALMPVTKLANTAIDRATVERAHVIEEIVQYAGNDLVCYWVDRPPELVQRQQEHWQPVMNWVEAKLSAKPLRATGLTHVDQPERLVVAVRTRVETLNAWQLTAVYLLTTLMGSAFIALMQLDDALDADAAWAAANVEEDYQISQWGEDWEAKIRREARERDYKGLVHFLSLLR
jgi:chaperone required for assembly of F1-ATPase